jgi:hypothetical protein
MRILAEWIRPSSEALSDPLKDLLGEEVFRPWKLVQCLVLQRKRHTKHGY